MLPLHQPVPLARLDDAQLAGLADDLRFLVIDGALLADPAESGKVTLKEVLHALHAAPDMHEATQVSERPAIAPRTEALGELAFPFSRNTRVTIGRRRTSEIVIRHSKISAAHAAIAPGAGRASFLIDLSSSNGTFLGDHCLAPGEAGRERIEPGAAVLLAKVRLDFLDAAQLRERVRRARAR